MPGVVKVAERPGRRLTIYGVVRELQHGRKEAADALASDLWGAFQVSGFAILAALKLFQGGAFDLRILMKIEILAGYEGHRCRHGGVAIDPADDPLEEVATVALLLRKLTLHRSYRLPLRRLHEPEKSAGLSLVAVGRASQHFRSRSPAIDAARRLDGVGTEEHLDHLLAGNARGSADPDVPASDVIPSCPEQQKPHPAGHLIVVLRIVLAAHPTSLLNPPGRFSERGFLRGVSPGLAFSD